MISPLMASLALFLMLSGGISLFGYRRYVRPARVQARLGQPVTMGNALREARKSRSERAVDLLKRLGELLPSGKAGEEIRRLLTMAGYRAPFAQQIFFGIRAAALLLLVSGALVFPLSRETNPAVRFIMLMGAAGVALRVPKIVLQKKVAARQERLRLSLPDALDLIIISVEAGLGIDQAIHHVGAELSGGDHKDLSDELQLIGMEMRAGLRRADALRSFAERTGEDEIQKLVAILIQNDRFGTSLGEALRNHSQYMRVARKQRADERAAKVGVKLVFPIFFLILPSMMVVAVGPGLLQIFKYLFPMMKQIH